jgi:hypothetical protein
MESLKISKKLMPNSEYQMGPSNNIYQIEQVDDWKYRI